MILCKRGCEFEFSNSWFLKNDQPSFVLCISHFNKCLLFADPTNGRQQEEQAFEFPSNEDGAFGHFGGFGSFDSTQNDGFGSLLPVMYYLIFCPILLKWSLMKVDLRYFLRIFFPFFG